MTTFELEPPRAVLADPPLCPDQDVLDAAAVLAGYAKEQQSLSLARQNVCFNDRHLRTLIHDYRAWCWLQAQCDRVLAPQHSD